VCRPRYPSASTAGSAQHRPPAKIKLVAFDVDGTLLRGPTICDCIAAGIGKQKEMQAVERGLTSTVEMAAAHEDGLLVSIP
jgi:hypothetical protein